MVREAAIFSEDLNNKHIGHSVVEDTPEKSTLKIGINMGSLNYNIFVIAESSRNLTIRIADLAKFTGEQIGKALEICNKYNRDTRWTTLYLTEENEVVIDATEAADDSFDGDKIFGLVGRSMELTGRVFPEFKAIQA